MARHALSEPAADLRPADALPGGMWLMKLRLGFDPREFPSAASDALRASVRTELDALLARAAQR